MSRRGQVWVVHRGEAGSEVLLVVSSRVEGKLWYHACLVLADVFGDRGSVRELGEGKHWAWSRADDRERIA